MRGQEDVTRFLTASGMDHEVRVLDQSTRTSALAAAALGCRVEEIAKSVVFVGAKLTVVVISGTKRVDLEKLSKATGGSVKPGTPDEVLRGTGYKIGGVPPFPHAPGVTVLVDRSIMEYGAVWAAAGASNAVFRMKPEALLRLTGGEALDLSTADA